MPTTADLAELFAEVPETTMARITRNLCVVLKDLAVAVLFAGHRALASLLLDECDTLRSIFAGQRLIVRARPAQATCSCYWTTGAWCRLPDDASAALVAEPGIHMPADSHPEFE